MRHMAKRINALETHLKLDSEDDKNDGEKPKESDSGING